MSPDLITTLVSTVGVTGALVWYLYHNTTKTIPDLTERYTKSMEKVSSEFSATLKDERVYRREEIDALRDWIKSEAKCKYNFDHPRGEDSKK